MLPGPHSHLLLCFVPSLTREIRLLLRQGPAGYYTEDERIGRIGRTAGNGFYR